MALHLGAVASGTRALGCVGSAPILPAHDVKKGAKNDDRADGALRAERVAEKNAREHQAGHLPEGHYERENDGSELLDGVQHKKLPECWGGEQRRGREAK
jgi:hypothetical protein